MATSGGIRFRELMMGGFALGESDPAAGERVGSKANNIFSLFANAAIPNVREFVSDPEHTGQLTGSVNYAPLGGAADGCRGQFKLFVRSQQLPEKSMIYKMGFQCQSRSFYLSGIKRVTRGALFHSWGETTTLFCRLHEGQDESGTVIGAGTLHLKLSQFIMQLASFRTVNANSFSGSTRAIAEFGKFFASELIDSYFG